MSTGGLEGLYFKDEAQNPPNWSFKARGTFWGIRHAISLGYRHIGAVSTGNMDASVAAYGARAGFETFIMVSAGIPEEVLEAHYKDDRRDKACICCIWCDIHSR